MGWWVPVWVRAEIRRIRIEPSLVIGVRPPQRSILPEEFVTRVAGKRARDVDFQPDVQPCILLKLLTRLVLHITPIVAQHARELAQSLVEGAVLVVKCVLRAQAMLPI